MKELREYFRDNPVAVQDLPPKVAKGIQALLLEAGYYFGKVDGIPGPLTQKAWEDFKEQNYLAYPHLVGYSSLAQLIDETKDENDVKYSGVNTKKIGTITIPGLHYKINLVDPIIANGHFYWYEATHNGERIPTDASITLNIIRLAEELERVRDRLDKPMIVTSWYRPPHINRRVGGASRSRHMTGEAVDLLVPGMNGRELAFQLMDWSGGLGTYARYPELLHLDVRGYKARW